MAGDGQVTLGDNVIKHSARKIRRLYQDKILAGFAGSTADAFSLFARFESKLEQYHGNLGRAAVERTVSINLRTASPNVMTSTVNALVREAVPSLTTRRSG